jgi:hypothetical protein
LTNNTGIKAETLKSDKKSEISKQQTDILCGRFPKFIELKTD